MIKKNKMRLMSAVLCLSMTASLFSGLSVSQVQAAELENLALSKNAFSTTEYHNNGQWNLYSLTDGKKLFTNDYQTNAGFHSIENDPATIVGIDLGTEQKFNEITLYPRIDDQTGGALVNYVEDFTIETSSDNDTWETVKTVTGNTNEAREAQTFQFDAQTKQYVRINVTKTTDGGTTLALAEFEVYYDESADNLFDEYTYEAFADDFSNQAVSNTLWNSNPTIQNGEYVLGLGINAQIKNKQFESAIYEADVKVEDADWIGLLFNKNNAGDRWDASGNMLYIRNDNATENKIELMCNAASGGSYATIPNHNPGDYIHLKVFSNNGTIKVYINNEQVISTTDNTYTSGYASFFVSGGSGQGYIDNVSIKTIPKVYENQVDTYMEELRQHKILRDDVSARFPKLPEGHTLTINSSDHENVIDLNGNVIAPDEETQVTLNMTVSCINPADSKTEDFTYTVPAKATQQDIAFTQNLEYGIFLHYIWGGQGSSTINEDGVQPDNIHEFVNDFDVDQVVADCKKFNTQYVIFTAWHYRANPLYYSEVYRKWRSDAENNNPSEDDKDIIMELADKLNAEGIDLLLYTHPNDLHDFSDADKQKFDYKGQGDTSFNKELYNEYLSEQYAEITTRYKGKIKGYFLDEGLGSPSNAEFVDYDLIRATIKDIDPTMAMIQNWSEVPGVGMYKCDTGMVEDRIQTSYGSGDWGDSLKTSIKDGSTWPSFGLSFAARIGERPFNWSAQYDKNGTFTGVDTGSFQTKKMTLASAKDIFRYTVYQAASNNEGMGSCWAFGPYSGTVTESIWEPGVGETMEAVGTLFDGIEDSVFGTLPSTSWPAKVDVDRTNPRTKTGSLGDVTYVAMSSSDGERQFVHVLNPNIDGGAVNGKTLTLPAPQDGKSYTDAKLVKDNTALTLKNNSDGTISITLAKDQDWNETDTAIELTSRELTIDDYNYTVFEDDFEDASKSGTKWTNAPTIENGKQVVPLGTQCGMKNIKPGSALYEFDWSCNSADWIGILLNRDDPNHTWDNSGCMIYMRNNGAVEAAGPGIQVTGGTGQIPNYNAGDMVSIRVLSEGGNITVYQGETVILTATTPYTNGYAGFFCSGTNGNGALDNVTVKTLPPTQDSDEAITEKFNNIKEELKKSAVYIDTTEIANLPEKLEAGYSYTMKKSSDSNIIDLKGKVTPSSKNTKVTITYELKYAYNDEEIQTDECEVTYDVKKNTSSADTAYFLDEKYGLFVHYVWAGQRRIGAGGQPEEISARYADGTKAQNIDEMIANFDAEQFAKDCKDMGMQYVIFTAWHYGMNPIYPSEVYKDNRTHEDGDCPTDDGNHDLIEKIYQELEKQGIDLYLYTHPYDIHDLYEEDKANLGYDSLGDLDFEYDKWNDYLNAQYQELCERYKGKIKGMFFDEGLAKPANNLSVDYPRLRDTVKSVDPTLLMIQNEYNGKYSCDTSMWELPTAWHGGNYNDLSSWQTNTIPIGTSIGNIYQGYSWWAIKNRGAGTDGLETAENAYLYTILQAGSNTEGGGMAWAAGPYCGNDGSSIWEDGVKERLQQVYAYMKPIESAVKNTRPSKSYVTPALSTYNTIDWGVATESADGKTTYLHIVKPPVSGKTITIGVPKDGKAFTEAKLLATGEVVSISQDSSGVSLTLPDTAEWDSLNTVIALTTTADSALQNEIQIAENKLQNKTPWMYSEEAQQELNDKLKQAKDLLLKSDATEKEMEQAKAAIEAAMDAYLNSFKTDSTAGENVASGKPVTSSSSLENGDFSNAYLTDGNKYGEGNRGWTSDPHSTTPNQTEWVQVDLGESKNVGRVDLSPITQDGYGFPEDFSVEVSEDGTNYVKVYETQGYHSDGTDLQIHFAAANARFIRITGTKLTPDQANGSSYRMQLSEVAAYPMSVEEAAYRVSTDNDLQTNTDEEQTKVVMPTAPEGFSVTKIVATSAEDVVDLEGNVAVPKQNTNVNIIFEVLRDSDAATANTRGMILMVAGKKVNKSELETLVNSLENIDLSKYTDESVDAYKKALKNAKEVLNNTNLTAADQQIVDDALTALEQAKNNLKVKPDGDTGNSGSSNTGGTNDSNSSDKGQGSDSNKGTVDKVIKAVKTGDVLYIGGYFVLLIGSISALIYLRKKKKHNS